VALFGGGGFGVLSWGSRFGGFARESEGVVTL
jgi:hypothetical protein